MSNRSDSSEKVKARLRARKKAKKVGQCKNFGNPEPRFGTMGLARKMGKRSRNKVIGGA